MRNAIAVLNSRNLLGLTSKSPQMRMALEIIGLMGMGLLKDFVLQRERDQVTLVITRLGRGVAVDGKSILTTGGDQTAAVF